MAKGNIVRWITIKGRRIPIYEDGSMGGFMEGKQASSKESNEKMNRENSIDDHKGSDKDSYSKTDKPHKVTVERQGEKVQFDSYGEGWEEGYHVEHTDYVGGKYIDQGKVGDYEVGEKVNYKYSDSDKPKPGTIVMAHKYPNGKVDYTVVDDKDGDGHSIFASNLSKQGDTSVKVGGKDDKIKSKSLEEHSDIQRIAEEHVKKIWNGGAANRELYDAADKWAEEHNFDKNKVRDAAFAAMNKKQMAEIAKRRETEGSKPSLNDIKGYGYDPHDVTGDPTIITADGRSYYKIGDDKWVAHSDSGRVLSGSISDKQMAERLSNAKDVKVIPAVKPNKSIKVGDKEVGVKKDKSMDDIFENRTTTRGTTPGMINTMSSTALRTQLRKAGLSSADMKGKDTEELRRMLLAIYKKR